MKAAKNFAWTTVVAFITICFVVLGMPDYCQASSLMKEAAPSLSLSAPDSIDISVELTMASAEAGGSVLVGTNSPTGYNLSLQSSSVDTCLKHKTQSGSHCDSIPNNLKFDHVVDHSATLVSNSWGISLDEGTSWLELPSSLDPPLIMKQTATASTDDLSISVGAAAGYDLTAGRYSGSTTFTAVSNRIEGPVISGISPSFGTAGDTITITGTGFDTAHKILIGGVECSSANIESATSLTCVLPDNGDNFNIGDKVDVTVKTWGGEAVKTEGLRYDEHNGAVPVIIDAGHNHEPFIDQVANDAASRSAYLLNQVTASDVEDGNITQDIIVSDDDGFDPSAPGTYNIIFAVTDSDGNTSTLSLEITVWNFVKLDSGWYHTLALTSHGRVYGWGYNLHGAVGDGTATNVRVPKLISALGDETIVDIAAGYQNSYAVTSDGKVYSWGWNAYGQLGINSTSPASRATPGLVNVPDGAKFKQISSSWYTAIAVSEDGHVYSWGSCTYGVCGTTTATNRLIPAIISNMTEVTQASVGWYHGAAVKVDGRLYTWGNDTEQELGDAVNNGYYNLPGFYSGLTNIKQVDVGYMHTIAVSNTGQVYTWGMNGSGQLGIGSTTIQPTPQTTIVANGVRAAAGYLHSALVTSTGNVYVAGANSYGKTGLSSAAGNTTTFTQNSTLTLAIQPEAAYESTFVLTDRGRLVKAFGYGGDYVLGNNSTTATNTTPLNCGFTPPAL